MGDKKNISRVEELERLLEEQHLLADAAFEALGLFDEDLNCLVANKATEEVFGYTQEELLTMNALDVLAEESHATVMENAKLEINDPYEVIGKRKGGATFPAEIRSGCVMLGGKPVRAGAIRDISRSRAAEDELKAALNELEIIFATSKVGMLYLQGGRILKRCNQTMADIVGYGSPEEMDGLDMRELHLSEERYLEFGKKHFAALTNGAQLNVEYLLRRKDGSPVWCSLSGQAVDTNRPANLDLGVLWVVDDITERKAAENRLRKMATTDDLTGALNRKEFFRQVAFLSQRDQRCPAGPAVLMVDIDHFKQINDTYGHEAGDMVLQNFAEKCRELLRGDDLLARMGGEEFTIFLPGADLGGAMNVAERLRHKIANSEIETRRGVVQCSISIGVAVTSSGYLSIEELLRRADESLYESKREGRNRVSFYD
ncbi:sensor domain-containing diguanylate cyclase [Pseudodesulfovibrio sp. zrk46]|uniref:sensor domain-containing diguanylate cyclase n=1 Tax=Pseudodesulfovibrio sp. zrk46 TaxID=2725288 RepID=UPI001449DDB0|nr:sensor domain-containing diguanylate cyclase [Pseudodesulfovibrio sp. zrk46]QJB55356.1 sensor domain-containing diguanylate cyclase [Pseudodesulfovibrio sp. zrk46]